MAVHIKHRALALAIALIGLASSASAQTLVPEEVRNGRFTEAPLNADPLRIWNDTNVSIVDRAPNPTVNNYAAKFDYGTDQTDMVPSFLAQSLGTFASGTSFTLSFDFVSVFKVQGDIIDNIGTKAGVVARNLAFNPLLQYGFQVLNGNRWNWVGSTGSTFDPDVSFADLLASEAGTTVSKTFDLTSTGDRRVRVAFAGLAGIDQYGFYPTIDNVSVQSITAVTAVPEPETYAMLLAGLGAIGFMSRRRKARTA